MPEDDIITRGDLDRNCDTRHAEFIAGFADVKDLFYKDMKPWLDKVEARQWRFVFMIITFLIVFIVGTATNIAVTLYTKQADISYEPRNSFYVDSSGIMQPAAAPGHGRKAKADSRRDVRRCDNYGRPMLDRDKIN